MKAILCETLGPPENLVLKDVKDPVAAENEAVVQVYAAYCHYHPVKRYSEERLLFLYTNG